jgi:hypothetical protein
LKLLAPEPFFFELPSLTFLTHIGHVQQEQITLPNYADNKETSDLCNSMKRVKRKRK